MNKLIQLQRLKQTAIVVLESLLASQVLKVPFCCNCLPTPFDIILKGHITIICLTPTSTILLVFTGNLSS